MLLNNLLSNVRRLPESAARNQYLKFIASTGEPALQRNGGPEHITGSCFVFSTDFDQVLLCFHRKGQFWVQFGGHVESEDESVAGTAQREAREESGIGDLALISTAIMDLDRHELHGGFSCGVHWDIGFAASVPADIPLTVSDESETLRWFPVHELPKEAARGLDLRVELVRRRALAGGWTDDTHVQ